MLVLVFAGLMLTATLSIVSVSAAPITIVVSPTSGTVGSTVTVSGENASSNGEVRVYLEGFVFMATTTANATGGYSVNITMPAVPAFTFGITALDVTTGDTNSASFTVQPKIILTPEEGSYNDTVTVKGSGFQDVSLITLLFNGMNVTPSPPPLTDFLGSFEATFNVPSMPNGTYTVTADDGINNASELFTVIPEILLFPETSGPPSTFVMVTGTGFAPSVNVTIEFDAINVANYGGIVTWLDGSFGTGFFPAVFFVPEVPNGTYIVNATDETGNSATAPFTVPSPVMTLTPNITSGSSIITATGSGFPPNMPVLLYLEDVFLVDLIDLMAGGQALFADEYGSYEYSFIVPVAKPGVYTVAAYRPGIDGEFAVGEEVASAFLTIVEDALLLDIKDEIATIIIPDLGTVKANLTDINAKLVSIEGTLATVDTDLGTVKANLTDINAKLVSIEGTLATVDTDLGTVKANLTDINAKLVSIDGNVATIETDLGTIETDISDIGAEVVPTGYEFNLLATILALVAAIGAWLSAMLIRKKPSLPKRKSK